MRQLMNDTVAVINRDGRTEDVVASVQKKKIFIDDVSIPIESGDIIERKLNNGVTERFEVTDAHLHSGFGGIPDFYEIEYERQGAQRRWPNPSTVQVDSDSIQEVALEADRRNVFVVHGRNQAARDAMFEFLRAIDLHPMEWSEAVHLTRKASPYIGEILDSAFSHARAVVVLFTPDDEARLRNGLQNVNDAPNETELTGQARPNVLFEAGMAMGRDQDRTVLVELGNLRPFSDIGGRHTIRLDNSPQRRQDLAQRLEAAGCTVNREGTDWFNVGDFEASVEVPDPSSEMLTDMSEDLSRFTIQPQLSADAVGLLVSAVEGGRITRIRVLAGTIITAGGREFTETGNRRSEARWESALGQLVELALVRDPTGREEIFEVTHEGYEIADGMEARTG